MSTPSLFPIFLKLEGRKVVVVGAGAIAEQKLASLLAAGAEINMVAPAASSAIREHALLGELSWNAREFIPQDLDGATLAIAATGDPEVNAQVLRAAEARGVLCNAVDDPDRCHFYYPAVVRRGDLQIAISTAGKSPALAQRVRLDLERQFDELYGDWLNWLGQVRSLFFRRPLEPNRRKRVLHEIAAQQVYERYKASRIARRESHHE